MRYSFIRMVVGVVAIMLLAQVAPAQVNGPPGNDANTPLPTERQVRYEAESLMRDFDDPAFDFSKAPPRIRQLFSDTRRLRDSMDPDRAQQFQTDLFQQFMPVFQKHQAEIQKAMQMAYILDLQQPLGCSDAEFEALKPSLEKVAEAQMATQTRRRFGPQPPAAPAQTAQQISPIEQATNDLQAAINDATSNGDLIRNRLDALRSLKDKASQDLEAARNDLRSLLTVRQEAVLVEYGLLD